MSEKATKRKARRDSHASSVEEPEAASLRTEYLPSISDKDFSEFSGRVEKSVCSRLKETETNQREILKMIENLSSKIESSSEKNVDHLDIGWSPEPEYQPENLASTSRIWETDGMTQDEGLHTTA